VPKTLTSEQLQARKKQAVRFAENVLGDSDRAEEIAEESLEDLCPEAENPNNESS
jgi:hypothetical protein